VGTQTFDHVRAEEAAAAGDEDVHRAAVGAGWSQSTRPIHRPRFSAYHWIVFATPSSHEMCGSHPVSAVSFSCPTRSAITSLEPGRKRPATLETWRSPP